MPKLIIQIPCYNEENTLAHTLSLLPRTLPGIDQIEWLVIDDGSTDRTVEVAVENGADHIVRHPRNQGLARAFISGLDACLKAGADIIVNTDADNQYCSEDIGLLIEPIMLGKAEIVIGSRPIPTIKHFSRTKKILQKVGSWVVRYASDTTIPDAPSGFRAFSREAAQRLNVFNEWTYTLETIIQAGRKGMAITSVPIRTNAQTRPSRLIKNIPDYIRKSTPTIVRIFMIYRPFRFFAVPGILFGTAGFLICLRFLFYYFFANGAGHVQSLILGALLIGIGFFLLIVGLVADLISVNRMLLEKLDWRIQKLEEFLNHKTPHL